MNKATHQFIDTGIAGCRMQHAGDIRAPPASSSSNIISTRIYAPLSRFSVLFILFCLDGTKSYLLRRSKIHCMRINKGAIEFPIVVIRMIV
ncbi:hypothetical protein [Paraburkholderia azotifigens]|uniref:Uncharacterized protein n=1 Tax=Paraburkholderia azotifigens TaxID=2057004 RepID=A0A5C6VF17_9BURK|nr:hypothetical protein [Paraburkholderia azotifigens]TXC82405.1 hypothetical protein FRZ40_18135 [Paraburkholderia azotifigens]